MSSSYLTMLRKMTVLVLFRKFFFRVKLTTPWLSMKRTLGPHFLSGQRGPVPQQGDYLWIAEADDVAERDFLHLVSRGFDNQNVVLSYSESSQIDEDGEKLADNYQYYLDDISTSKWKRSYVNDGRNEIQTALAVKNTIPQCQCRSVLIELIFVVYWRTPSMKY